MADLTEDRFLETLDPQKYTKRSGPAAAATYFSGDIVMKGGDDGQIKHVSGSAVAGTNVVGFVKDKQVIATAGDQLQFLAGPLGLTANGFSGIEWNAVVYMEDDTVAYAAHSAGRHVAGKVLDFVSGSTIDNTIMVDVGTVVSGNTTP
jgi:hypothetical protein